MSDETPTRGYQELDISGSEPLVYHPGPSVMTVTLTPDSAPTVGGCLMQYEARMIGADHDIALAYRALCVAVEEYHRLAPGDRVISRTVTITITEKVEAR